MTYEYACGACGHEWEAEQSIRDEPLKKCPKCGKPQAKRQISRGAGFILKGGGWYADGYGSSGASAGGKGSSKSSETSSGGDGGSGDKPTGSDNKGKTAAA
jgi:putative FmdB family regulatory protein